MSELISQNRSAQPILRTSPNTNAAKSQASSNVHGAANGQVSQQAKPQNSKQQSAPLFRSLRAVDPSPQSSKTPDTEPEFRFHNFAELAKIPPKKHLIRRMLLVKRSSIVNADSEGFKTFFTVCMGLSIASGRSFFGHEVTQGNVVYVAAEGFDTIYERALAWALHHNCPLPTNFHILDMPLNVADAGVVKRFGEAVAAFDPALIVLDTLSQCATGLVENSNEDMARFVQGMMNLGKRVGAHVLATHHNAKATGALRGASAIHNNVDTRISLERPEDDTTNTVYVRNEKQRGKHFEPFTLRGIEVTLPYEDEYGDPVTSLVFELCDDAVAPKATKQNKPKRSEITRKRLLDIFDVLATEYEGVKIGTWMTAATESENPVCKGTTFWDYRTKFVDEGIIVEWDTHQGSKLYYRAEAAPVTPETSNRSRQSNRSDHHPDDSGYSTPNPNPLGFGVSGVESDGGVKNTRSKTHTPKQDQYRR